MANYCSNCGERLPNPTARFCSECGAEQGSNGSISTNIKGNANGATIIAGGRDVNFDKGESVICPDCFGTGIEHIECPKCDGSGLTKVSKFSDSEIEADIKKRAAPSVTAMNIAENRLNKKNPNMQDKVVGNIAAALWLLSAAKEINNVTKFYGAEENLRESTCPVCEGRKFIPINHEENLKETRLHSIPVCTKCNGYKKVYLPD